MRAVGVIAEYNPFHQGHAFHLAQARERSGADCVAVVMSSCVTQRGEFALLSPAARARMALACGADAVFALPAAWAARDAEHFALGGVALLKGMGVDAISFGVEQADLPLLRACARLLEEPDAAFRARLRELLSTGLPYPAALSAAAQERIPGAEAVLSSPNATLAVCYLRAMLRLHADMEVIPVPRQGSYHATGLSPNTPSATALRGAILRGDWAGARAAMPPAAYTVLEQEALCGRIHRPESLDGALTYRLRAMGSGDWAALPDLSEGIEDRLMAAAAACSGREKLLQRAKTRRYPYARLSRLCAHALLGITAAQLDREPLPPAAWLLGLTDAAAPLLRRMKQSGFPIIGKAADYPAEEAWFRTELLAYDLWALGCGMPAGLSLRQGVVHL